MEYLASHSLSLILLISSIAGLAVAILPNMEESKARTICLYSSLATLFIAIRQYFIYFDSSNTGIQLVEKYDWIGKIQLSLGVDGLGFSMVLLMAILMPVCLIASKPIAEKKQARLYYSLIMFLSVAVYAVFMAQDIFLFFLAWELELVPMYFLIAIWGSKNRNYASMKFLIYTFAAGVALLVAIFGLLSATGFATYDMVDLSHLSKGLALSTQTFLFAMFALCFLVKLPSIPFHTWLPDAHVEAPTPVSMLLAGILLKMGCYGLLRFGLEFFPIVVVKFAPWIAIFGAINIIYAAYAALIQKDMKKLIAYSSVSHMGFVLLGLGALNSAGYNGAAFQMFSHGLISAALFMLIGMIYERAHTREISELGGLAKVMPKTYYIFIMAAMANLGLPGLSGFVGESLVFYGSYTAVLDAPVFKICTAVAALGVILTAAYMLWLNQRVFYGKINEKWMTLTDIRASEVLVLSVLLGGSLIIGFYPKFINKIYEPQLSSLTSYTNQYLPQFIK